jgi:muramoyltetrapeptide carboxypeptidase LdcA involved in peptidoglycan recycling
LWEFTLDNLNDLLTGQTKPLSPSKRWMSNGDKKVHKTKWSVLNEGLAEGVLIGGNLGTFYLLQGTEYQPAFDKPFILAVEEDNQSGEYTAHEFARHLESILQLPHVRKNIQGLLIGRFEHGTVSSELLHQILTEKQLDVPIIVDMDFGHTVPMLSLPIGGHVTMSASDDEATIQLQSPW